MDVYDIVASPKSGIKALVWSTWSRVQDLALGYVCGYEPSDPAKLRAYIERIPKSPNGWQGWNQIGALCSSGSVTSTCCPCTAVPDAGKRPGIAREARLPAYRRARA
jgi:hypothetical protein